MYDTSKFGNRINIRLKDLGKKKSEMIFDLNLNATSFYRWMDGTYLPSVPTLVVIAEYLDVSIDWLLGECADDER